MDFTIPADIAALRDRIEAFVEAHLLPLEADPSAYDAHENIAPTPLAQRLTRRGLDLAGTPWA